MKASGTRGKGLIVCARVLIALLAGRRILMLAAALLPRRDSGRVEEAPTVTIAIPVFNEAEGLPDLFAALEGLEYPRDRLRTVLVDDCSTDGSGALIRAWAEARPGVTAIGFDRRSGKSAALDAVTTEAETDLVLTCDADLRPRPDLLRSLVGGFADADVGAVAAYLAPINSDASLPASYASLESWVHQLVTSRGKDRLRLDPPVHGCVAYRTAALRSIARVGGTAPGDDVRGSVALSRNGWRTRFSSEAVAENVVVSTWTAYWHQHVRWARNLLSTRRVRDDGVPRSRDPLPWRLVRGAERIFMAAGYADRLVLAGALLLAMRRRIPGRLAVVYPAVIACEVIVAAVKVGRGRRAPSLLLIAVAGAGVDLLASIVAIGSQLLRRPHRWTGDAPHRRRRLSRTAADREASPAIP